MIPVQEEADVIRNTLQAGLLHRRGGRPGPHLRTFCVRASPPAAETARDVLNRLFFSPKRYDLAKVGRYKLNQKLNHEELLGGTDRMKRLGLTTPRLRPAPPWPRRTSSPSSSTCSCSRVEPSRRHHRRHRPSRQPPGAFGGRASGQPVQHRADPDGAHHPRADEPAGLGEHHPLRPGERPHDQRGDPVVLRVEPALPVHGPDQSAGRADPQAAALRPRAGRTHPRPGRLRGPRRPLHPLRAHVPDRDPGRPEHRAHLLAGHLRPGERVRVPGDALPQGQGRRRSRDEVAFISADVEDAYRIAQANEP